jgi:preprotein translocase subunit SecG
MLLFLNVIFVLVAVSMIVLILMQRGAGAQAGSGFGGGASGTVFGSRGSANFLSKATKWLAVVFFVITFFMAWQATQGARVTQNPGTDLGLMSDVPATPATPTDDAAVPSAPDAAVESPASSVPASSVPPAPATDDAAVPVAPPVETPPAPEDGG